MISNDELDILHMKKKTEAKDVGVGIEEMTPIAMRNPVLAITEKSFETSDIPWVEST